MNKIAVALLFASHSCIATSASSFIFEGYVSNTFEAGAKSPVAVGSRVTGSYSYDPIKLLYATIDIGGVILIDAVQESIDVTNVTYQSKTYKTVISTEDQLFGVEPASCQFCPPPDSHVSVRYFGGQDPQGVATTNPPFTSLFFNQGGNLSQYTVVVDFTNVANVSEPESGLLMGLGLFWFLSASRRSQRAQRSST